MFKVIFIVSITTILASCDLPNSSDAEIRYKTKNVKTPKIPAALWEKPKEAKEIINLKEKKVVVNVAPNPLSDAEWKDFSTLPPWRKNINRNLLFTKSFFYRSPSTPRNCKKEKCYTTMKYKKRNWMDLAIIKAVDFIPDETDLLHPKKGHLVVKVIEKCHIVVFEKVIYEMSNDKGDKYVMHAIEKDEPDLSVILPKGFQTTKKVY